MSSEACQVLEQGLQEALELLQADPTPRGGLSPNPALTRAVTRACVVILCSHFERYLRSATEEAVALLNKSEVQGESLPERFRLQHSRTAIEDLARMQWPNRAKSLEIFVKQDAWLWGKAEKGTLDHRRLLQWMKSPKPNEVKRLFRLWDIDDIFAAITRKSSTRQQFYFRLDGLVNKRNNIAHGDIATETTASEVREYIKTVAVFCDRVDRRLARMLEKSLGIDCDWY